MDEIDYTQPDWEAKTQAAIDRASGVWTTCQSCDKEFKIIYDEHPAKMTIKVCACESGGIYGVSVICPHCNHEESIY